MFKSTNDNQSFLYKNEVFVYNVPSQPKAAAPPAQPHDPLTTHQAEIFSSQP
jgi:hypothetical protein